MIWQRKHQTVKIAGHGAREDDGERQNTDRVRYSVSRHGNVA